MKVGFLSLQFFKYKRHFFIKTYTAIGMLPLNAVKVVKTQRYFVLGFSFVPKLYIDPTKI